MPVSITCRNQYSETWSVFGTAEAVRVCRLGRPICVLGPSREYEMGVSSIHFVTVNYVIYIVDFRN